MKLHLILLYLLWWKSTRVNIVHEPQSILISFEARIWHVFNIRNEKYFKIAQIICDFEAYITLIERCHFHLGQNGNAFECGKMKINTRQNSTIWVMVWLTEWNSWPPFPNLALKCLLTTFPAAFINITHFDRLLSTWLRILLINSLYLPCYCYSLMWSERHFWVVTSF